MTFTFERPPAIPLDMVFAVVRRMYRKAPYCDMSIETDYENKYISDRTKSHYSQAFVLYGLVEAIYSDADKPRQSDTWEPSQLCHDLMSGDVAAVRKAAIQAFNNISLYKHLYEIIKNKYGKNISIAGKYGKLNDYINDVLNKMGYKNKNTSKNVRWSFIRSAIFAGLLDKTAMFSNITTLDDIFAQQQTLNSVETGGTDMDGMNNNDVATDEVDGDTDAHAQLDVDHGLNVDHDEAEIESEDKNTLASLVDLGNPIGKNLIDYRVPYVALDRIIKSIVFYYDPDAHWYSVSDAKDDRGKPIIKKYLRTWLNSLELYKLIKFVDDITFTTTPLYNKITSEDGEVAKKAKIETLRNIPIYNKIISDLENVPKEQINLRLRNIFAENLKVLKYTEYTVRTLFSIFCKSAKYAGVLPADYRTHKIVLIDYDNYARQNKKPNSYYQSDLGFPTQPTLKDYIPPASKGYTQMAKPTQTTKLTSNNLVDILANLMEEIPEAGETWPINDRLAWLQAMEAVMRLAYQPSDRDVTDKNTIKILLTSKS